MTGKAGGGVTVTGRRLLPSGTEGSGQGTLGGTNANGTSEAVEGGPEAVHWGWLGAPGLADGGSGGCGMLWLARGGEMGDGTATHDSITSSE
jgi:hypothetical protein